MIDGGAQQQDKKKVHFQLIQEQLSLSPTCSNLLLVFKAKITQKIEKTGSNFDRLKFCHKPIIIAIFAVN